MSVPFPDGGGHGSTLGRQEVNLSHDALLPSVGTGPVPSRGLPVRSVQPASDDVRIPLRRLFFKRIFLSNVSVATLLSLLVC